MNEKTTIFCDMDGVLCDFVSQLKKKTGMTISQFQSINNPKERWKKVIESNRFWHDMPWMPGGKEVWNYIKKYNVRILSAYVEGAFDPNCIPGKRYWAQKNLGLNQAKVHLVERKDKKRFAVMNGEPCILIDDYIKNINEFNQAGGKGIQFTTPSKVIAELKKLGL